MQKRYTLLLFNHNGAPLTQINLTRWLIFALSGLGLLCAFGVGLFFYDYADIKKRFPESENLRHTIAKQETTIEEQLQQIESLANSINTIKNDLLELYQFEEKIRIIANIEKPDNQDNLFGVGGQLPPDLAPLGTLRDHHKNLVREMHAQVDEIHQIAVSQQQNFGDLLKILKEQRNLLASRPAIRPTTGWITSTFGYRKSPFTGLRSFHHGLDYANKIGTEVIATADGVITYAGRRGLLGKTIVLDHGHGFITRYGHLNKYLKKRGDYVKRGDIIALMGNTGRSTGPHLHYEVRLNGLPVNPEKYILN